MTKSFRQFEKIIISIIGGVFGLLVGIIVRLFSYPTTFGSTSELLAQYLPWMSGFMIVFASLSYMFPKTIAFLLEMFFGVELGVNQEN